MYTATRAGSFSLRGAVFCVLVFILITAFTAHDIQLAHEHAHAQSHGHEDVIGVAEYMHASDRKLLAVITVFVMLSWWFTAQIERHRTALRLSPHTLTLRYHMHKRRLPRHFDWQSVIFRRGVIQNQQYG